MGLCVGFVVSVSVGVGWWDEVDVVCGKWMVLVYVFDGEICVVCGVMILDCFVCVI